MRTLAIGIMGFLLASGTAAAQTAIERDRILREFRHSVTVYQAQHQCLDLLPEALNASVPPPRIFTLPVAMVFRQIIAGAVASTDALATMRGASPPRHHVSVLEPLPATALDEFPQVLERALPPLPEGLEYRLIDHDLVVRDAGAGVIVAVLRDAVGSAPGRE
jgi:hypothetical protein